MVSDENYGGCLSALLGIECAMWLVRSNRIANTRMSFNLKQAEWKELRDEAISLAHETRKLEQLAVVATGAVYAWVATHKLEMGAVWILPWFIPVLFAAAGALRSWAIAKQIGHMSAYLTEIEKELSAGGGWETFFSTRRGYLYRTAVTFWTLLLVVTIAVPLLMCASS